MKKKQEKWSPTISSADTQVTTLDKNVQNLSSVFANNKGPDKPAHLRNMISTFVIRLLESIISKLATSKFLNL